MSLEVYLLSIPLARHRTIVPKHRGTRVVIEDPSMQAPDHRARAVTGSTLERSSAPSARQRLDRD